jgi:ATP-dependent DNA ligase
LLTVTKDKFDLKTSFVVKIDGARVQIQISAEQYSIATRRTRIVEEITNTNRTFKADRPDYSRIKS